MKQDSHSLQTPLARARGLGSAKEGTDHWWKQRLTSIALIPLGLWFAFSIALLAGSDFDSIRQWMQSPFSATMMILFIIMGFHHASSGLQVIIEDYIHLPWLKLIGSIGQKFFFLALAIACIVSVLKLALEG